MNRIDVARRGPARRCSSNVQVRLQRLARLADQVGLVGLEAVEGVAVFVRVDRDRANAQFVGAAKDADGDFAAIGDEQSANWLHGIEAMGAGK